MRAYMDGISDGLDLPSSFTPVDVAGVPAEWVLAPGADPLRRVLYIHGGAFMMKAEAAHDDRKYDDRRPGGDDRGQIAGLSKSLAPPGQDEESEPDEQASQE